MYNHMHKYILPYLPFLGGRFRAPPNTPHECEHAGTRARGHADVTGISLTLVPWDFCTAF